MKIIRIADIGFKHKVRKAPKPRPQPTITDFDLGELRPGPKVVFAWPPIQLSPNARCHFMELPKWKNQYRRDCAFLAHAAGLRQYRDALRSLDGPIAFGLDFFPPPGGRRYDEDNAEAAFKAGQDGLADALTIDDSRFRMVKVHHHDRRLCCIVVTLITIGADQ